jgi:hypothetical protein
MKKITTLLIVVAATVAGNHAFAQFNKVWTAQYQHTTGPGFSNEGRKIAEDPSGNIFELSDVTSDIDPSGLHTLSTYHYVVLNKYSTAGVLLASTNLDIQKHITSGFNNFSAFGLEVDASGYVYIGFSTWTSIAAHDVMLIKFSNTLTRVWGNLYSTAVLDEGVEMKVVSGTVYAVVKSDNGTTASYTVIKSVPSNNPPVTVYTFPANSAVINSIAVDASLRAFVAGYTMKGGYKNAYIAAINTSTNSVNWQTAYSPAGITGDDVFNKITVGIDGNIYTVGTTYQGISAGDEVIAVKNLPGNPRFDFIDVMHNAQSNDKGLFVNAAESGWVYLGTLSSNLQAIVYRIPSSGIFSTPGKVIFTPLPSAAYNNITGVTLNAMKVSSAKNVYIAGGIDATGPSGAFTSAYLYKSSVVFGNALVHAGGATVDGGFNNNAENVDISLDYGKADVYWLRNSWDNLHNSETVELTDLNVPNPLREAQATFENNLGSIMISPNPAHGMITIHADANLNNIEVMDITGNRVLDKVLSSGQFTVDVSGLSDGIYLCKIRTDAGETIRRLIIN